MPVGNAAVEVDVHGEEAIQEALHDAGEDAQRALQKGIASSAFEMQSEAKLRAPTGVGNRLRSAIRWRFVGPRKLNAAVGVFEGTQRSGWQINYAPYVEFGTRAAVGNPMGDPPPVEPIKLWVQRVLGAKEPSTTYLVWRSIWQEGTDPQPFLEPSMLSVREVERNIIRAAQGMVV